MHLSKRLVERYFRDGEAIPPLSSGRKAAADHACAGSTKVSDAASAVRSSVCSPMPISPTRPRALIYAAIARHAGERGKPIVKAVLDPFNPAGSTDHVSFITSKETLWQTRSDRSHINYVVCDSDWEAEFARVVEGHPRHDLLRQEPSARFRGALA